MDRPQAPVDLDRRALLTAIGAAALSGCSTWPDLPTPNTSPTATQFIDVHAHLFNGSDLPIVSFLDHVFIRQKAGELAEPAQGLIDLFMTVIKPLAVSVDAEERASRSLRAPPLEVTPDQFADAATARTLEAATSEGFVASQALANGHRALAMRVTEAYGRGKTFEPSGPRGDLVSTLRDSYRALAQDALTEGSRAPAGAVGLVSSEDVDAAVRTLKWGFLMMQGRTQHLARYLTRQVPETSRPLTIVNHLVDYDRWLDDAPLPASSHDKQIRLWGKISRHYKSKADIRTFAGFCPLKQAHDRISGRSDTHLDQLKAAYARGDIAGLKLYPPMGFRASGNAARAWPAGFTAVDGVRDRIVTDWTAAAGPNPPHLGVKLDEALEEAFEWAADKLPILAHAGPSNAPGEGFELNADPKYWIDVANDHKTLRIALGHLVHDAVEFVKQMTDSTREPRQWALGATRDLIRDPVGRQSNVFVDLAYTEELLTPSAAASGLPKVFFEQLRRYCVGDDGDGSDPDMSQIMFGSDWIMLGLEPQHSGYLTTLITAMKAAKWEDHEIHRVCFENAKRWLG